MGWIGPRLGLSAVRGDTSPTAILSTFASRGVARRPEGGPVGVSVRLVLAMGWIGPRLGLLPSGVTPRQRRSSRRWPPRGVAPALSRGLLAFPRASAWRLGGLDPGSAFGPPGRHTPPEAGPSAVASSTASPGPCAWAYWRSRAPRPGVDRPGSAFSRPGRQMRCITSVTARPRVTRRAPRGPGSTRLRPGRRWGRSERKAGSSPRAGPDCPDRIAAPPSRSA